MTEQWRGARSYRPAMTWDGVAIAAPLTTFRPDHNKVGFNVALPNSSDSTQRTNMWARIVATGAKIVRTDCYWAALQPTNAGPPSAPTPTPGGVYTTCQAWSDPTFGHTAGIHILGTDVSGFSISFDGGTTYDLANFGINGPEWLRQTCSVEFDPHHPDQVVAYVGNLTQNALLRGVINAVAQTIVWSVVVSNVATATSGALYLDTDLQGSQTGGTQTARRTGKKLVADPFVTDRWYVGTKAGVCIWNGSSTVTALSATWVADVVDIAGLCLDPKSTISNTILWAVAYSTTGATTTGLYRVANAEGTPTVGTVVAGTSGLTALKQCVAVLEGSDTVVYFTNSVTGSTSIKKWNDTTSTLTTAGWTGLHANFAAGGIDAVRIGSATTVVVAHNGSGSFAAGRVAWSTNGGSSWTAITGTERSLKVGFDDAGTDWWLATGRDGTAEETHLLGVDNAAGSSYYNSVKIRPDAPSSTWSIVGHAGCWGTRNAGAKWYPQLRGLAGTVGHQTLVHPTSAGVVFYLDEDWVLIRNDNGVVRQMKPSVAVYGGAAAEFIDDGSLIVATNDRDTNTLNKVWYYADPLTNNAPVDITGTGLPSDKRIIGLHRVTNGTTKWVVAVVNDAGIYRAVESATTLTWSADLSGGAAFNTAGASINRCRAAFASSGATVYLSVPDDATNGGLWRSTDYGATWARIWTYANTSRSAHSIAIDGTTPTTIYVAVNTSTTPTSGIYRIPNANSGAVTATLIMSIDEPGPIDVDPATNRLWVTSTNENKSGSLYPGSQLWLAVAPTTSTDFAEMTTVDWSTRVAYPHSLDAANLLVSDAHSSHTSVWAGPGSNDTLDATNLGHLDAFFDDAETNGVYVWLNVAYTPNWANASAGDDKVPPSRELDATNLGPDYANFCWLIADRYSTSHPNVLAAMGVWNEPNVSTFWKQPTGTGTQPAVNGTPDAGKYSYLLQGAYAAIKTGVVTHRSTRTAHPEILVTAGCTAPASGLGNGSDYLPAAFVDAFCDAGATDSFDHLDHHPYCWQLGPSDTASWNAFRQMNDLWAQLEDHGRTDATIWCSEIGAISRPDASLTDTGTLGGVGGYDTGAPGGGWNTDSSAINYTLLAQRVTEMFTAWRSATYYDDALGKHKLGPMVWYELADKAAGIGTAWGGASEQNYFGLYEQGASRWVGAAKGTAVTAWITGAAQDVTAPTGVAVIAPGASTTCTGPCVIAITATDDRDEAVETVQVLIDGTVVGQATHTPLGYFYTWDSRGVADGAHTLSALATDNAGNSTLSATVSIEVYNPVSVVERTVLATVIDETPRWVVFARNRFLERVGVVDYTKLAFVKRHNLAGTWTLTAPDDDVAQQLLLPGAGIVVERNDVAVFNGIVVDPDRSYEGDGRREIEVSGVDDLGQFADRVIVPTQLTSTTYNTYGVDLRTGVASAVILGFIDSNAANPTDAARDIYGLTITADPGLGTTDRKTGRFGNLLEIISGLAARSDPELTVKVRQVGVQLLVTVEAIRDQTRTQVFSVEAGTLRAYKFSAKAPTVNYAYVGGGGVGSARVFVEPQDSTSIAEFRRVEQYIDQRQTTDVDELAKAGTEAFVQGAAKVTIELDLVADLNDWPNWTTGDRVTAVIDGEAFTEVVRELEVTLDESGESLHVVVGPPGATSSKVPAVFRAQRQLSSRLTALETI